MIAWFGTLLGSLASSVVGGIFSSNSQNNQYKQAKSLAQQQLDNSMTLATQSHNYKMEENNREYGYNIKKAELDDEITRRQNEQTYGYQKQLADDNYDFQNKQLAEKERAADETLEREHQMKNETTTSARKAASSAFYGNKSFNRFASRR